jgi:Flp pilus assembly protein TadG
MTSLLFRMRKFWIDADAVAAVEFAIVAPFMLLLYVGGVELGNAYAINVKVSATAHSIADMVSQNTSLSTSRMQTLLANASTIIGPYPLTNNGASIATITVSEISTDANGNATVQWSQSYNGISFGAGRPVGQAITLPSSLNGTVGNVNNPNNQNDNISVILGEVTYAYTPNLGYTISGTVPLQDSDYLFPRCSTDSPANSSGPAYYDVKYTASTTTCTCVQHLQKKTC